MNGFAGRVQGTLKPQLESFFLAVLAGLLLGTFVLVIMELPIKFTYFLIAGPVILFIAILSRHFKRFFQGVLIFIIPLNLATHFFRRPYLYGEKGLTFSPLDIVLLLLCTIWFYEIIVNRNVRIRFFPSITIPGLCLVGMTLLSMIQASDPYLTLFEAIQMLKVVILCFYVANHLESRRDLGLIIMLLLLGLFIQSLIAMAQRWLGVSLGLHLFGEYQQQTTFTMTADYYLIVARVGGTIGHPNNLAKYIELLIPLSLVLFFTRIKFRSKLASGAVFTSAFIVLLVTLSRGGWLCFAGSIILVFLLVFRAGLIRLQTIIAIGVALLVLGAVFLSFSGMVTNRLLGDDYGSAWNRVPLNKLAIEVIKHHPILGVGAKNYWSVMGEYRDVNIPIVNVVHNAYLLCAAEMGIPGLVILIWLMVTAFLAGLRNLRLQDSFLVCINIGVLSGLAALWAHWLVDPGEVSRMPIMWVLIAVILASSRIEQGEGASISESGFVYP
jgi:putative inorganic carbon (HCO3(-)) transporter